MVFMITSVLQGSLIFYCSLKTYLINQTEPLNIHYKRSFSEPATIVDVRKNTLNTNQNNIKVISLEEIFPDKILIKNGKENVSMRPYTPQIDKESCSATILK
jgi:hypothetical protein